MRKHKDTIENDLELFRDLINRSNDAIFVNDPESRLFIFVNDKACVGLGYDRRELLSMGVMDIETTFPDVFSWKEHVKELRERGHLMFEGVHRRKNGSTFPVEVNISYVTMHTREYMVAVVRDVTERRQAEFEKERLAKAVSIVTEGIAITDEEDRYIYLNDAHAATYGYLQSELIGKTWRELTPRELLPVIETELTKTLHNREKGVWSGEAPGLCKDGTMIATEVTATARWKENGGYLGHICVVRDITERKRAEERLRQNEQFIRSILDSVDEGFIVIDRDFHILTANKSYCEQVGGVCDEIIGRHCYEISHRLIRPCYEEGEECAVRRVFETGQPHGVLHKHTDHHGNLLFVETKGYPIKDGSGNVISVIETINNITEKHLLEEERLKTQKLESIGTLAGGIAHDFNNLLQGIFGYISMAKITLDQKEKSLAMLEQAENALHQSVSLTTQLLTFSKGGKPVKKRISLVPVIENATKFALSGSRSGFRLDTEPGLWQVDADGGQLGQVIQNMVLNADQAMPEGGSVVITARNVLKPDRTHPHLPKGNYVEVSVQDSGIGIPRNFLQKIFDPYFTTKEKGSGLGLSTSYSIVRSHGGLIDVISEPGKGTTFFICLPAVEAEKEFQAAPGMTPVVRRGKILVMDDEELVRGIAEELIKALGHEVDLAEDGEAAIEKYRAARGAGKPFDIVILDLTIRGGMGGRDAFERLRTIDPGVRAVVSSGYSDDTVMADYEQYGFSARLTKPYKLDDLRDTLSKMMSR